MKENNAEMCNAAGLAYGDLIREYRKKKKMSQEQLGSLANVKKNAVGAWEAGRSRPDVASIPVLCEALDIPLNVFFGVGEQGDSYRLRERFDRLNDYNRQVIVKQMDALFELQNLPESPARNLVRLYQNDLSAAAGPISYLGDGGGEMVYVVKDEVTAHADEIIRVSGDSMEPTYHDGDLVFVQHTEQIKPGEIGIFVNSDAGYIKEYRKDGLYSHNPKYGPIRFSGEDSVRCVGRVLGILESDQIPTDAEIASFTGYRV